ncbi:hypothetical protein Hypma_011264 [Hypsizygus marmoreus]|uniref:Uncharacterized protein n=1 Tax=Hypsizygus marmoreus TaxID=39966 RepID=A0A369JHD0_HYPMA|nr:hypothetical protein Hypma_011264 [Hypsizygus marmoreus]
MDVPKRHPGVVRVGLGYNHDYPMNRQVKTTRGIQGQENRGIQVRVRAKEEAKRVGCGPYIILCVDAAQAIITVPKQEDDRIWSKEGTVCLELERKGIPSPSSSERKGEEKNTAHVLGTKTAYRSSRSWSEKFTMSFGEGRRV